MNEVLPYVTNAQIGDSTDSEFLRSLGVRNYDFCIVAIGDDFQSSLETTSLLKELGAQMVISRAARDVHAKFLLRNGADEVVYPEKQLAVWTAVRYSADHILDYVQLDIRNRHNINIMALKHDGSMDMNIRSDTVLPENHTMLVLGNSKDIQKCFHI